MHSCMFFFWLVRLFFALVGESYVRHRPRQRIDQDMPGTALNPNFKEDIEAFVLRIPIVRFIQLRFVAVEHGRVEISIPYRDELSFTPGSFQAGPIGMLMDIAACSAVGTKLPAGWSFSAIDFTTKILAPAAGDGFLARRDESRTSRLREIHDE